MGFGGEPGQPVALGVNVGGDLKGSKSSPQREGGKEPSAEVG